MDESQTVKNEVMMVIDKDPGAAEFNFGIFSGALLSYRKHSCLRPFPNIYQQIGDDSDHFEYLTSTFGTIPPIADFHKHTLSDDTWRLIQWICNKRSFNVKSCKTDVLKNIQNKTGDSSFSLQPDQIYEIIYKSGTSHKFDEMKEKYGIKYGYHGSRLDNFYSIINNGLQVHMMKNGLFGEGIYLSDDLSVTMPYTKSGRVWNHSRIGEQISCVALCELIDHPGVKCQVENDPSKKRSIAKNSESGEVPERYFIATSGELVRIKYVLVFADKKPKQKVAAKKPWIFQKYPVACILFLYAFFLVLMGLRKSHSFKLFYHKYFQRNDDDDNDF